MKYRFTNGTVCDRRKGREALAPYAVNHPTRETVIHPLDSHLPTWALPVRVVKPEPAAPVLSDEEKLRMEVARILAERSKAPRPVPKSRLIGMATSGAPDATKEYADVLAMLLGKK